jgi:hypothetical protein
MTENNIENMRRNAIQEVKEKIKKNLKYTHPCNKERKNDEKRLKFSNGYEYTCWMQQNGIMKSLTCVDRKALEVKLKNAGCKTEYEYQNMCAKILGYKDQSERTMHDLYEKGICVPSSEDEDLSQHFGNLGEQLFKKFLSTIFENVERMKYTNYGFDFTCSNISKEFIEKYPIFKLEINKEYTIQIKARCRRIYGKYIRWDFPIKYNNADYFILISFDNRENLNIMHIWVFRKNEIVRGDKFWRRDTFTITDTPFKLEEFKSQELVNELTILKELNEELKKENDIGQEK